MPPTLGTASNQCYTKKIQFLSNNQHGKFQNDTKLSTLANDYTKSKSLSETHQI